MARKKVPKAAADSPSLACDDASQEVGEVRNLEARILKWREGEVLSRAGKRRERESERQRGEIERETATDDEANWTSRPCRCHAAKVG